MNPFFQGTNAGNISVAAALMNDPSAIAAGQTTDSGDGSNATAISNLNKRDLRGVRRQHRRRVLGDDRHRHRH